MAEAFAWKVTQHSAREGVIALVLPAMTLFKDESRRLRSNLFRRMRVWCVADFANLAYVLFGGRAQAPAAVLFYGLKPLERSDLREDRILTYSPLVANQQANRSTKSGKRKPIWSIAINASEIKEVSVEDAASGEALPWKLAIWGSCLDHRLLRKVDRACSATLEDFAKENHLAIHKGIELRHKSSTDKKRHVPDLAGRNTVDSALFRSRGKVFAIPADALTPITVDRAYIRARGGMEGLKVSYPPHILVDASRRFAIYSDDFVAIPGRHIGISGEKSQIPLLKALSLYLSSDFVTYHQFLTSPQWGVSFSEATLEALRSLPIPTKAFSDENLGHWVKLHEELVRASAASLNPRDSSSSPPTRNGPCRLIAELNNEVYQVLGLQELEKALVNDLVHVRMQLVKGKVSEDVVKPPSKEAIEAYLAHLASALDSFLEIEKRLRHEVKAVYDGSSAMISIRLKRDTNEQIQPSASKCSESTARQLNEIRQLLRRQHSQWVYFDRGLRVYKGSRTYLFKPMQRMLWSTGQALVDATEMIAETIANKGK